MRIPAVTRDGKRQGLIAVNIGGKSYEEWAKNAGKRKYNVKLYFKSNSPQNSVKQCIGTDVFEQIKCKGKMCKDVLYNESIIFVRIKFGSLICMCA